MEELTILEREQDERGKVESEADLHEAVELVGHRGCSADVAAQILL